MNLTTENNTDMPRPLVVPLVASSRYAADLIGHKAANLIALMRAGQNVPSAFCLTTETYDEFVRSNGIDLVIADQLGRLIDLQSQSVIAASSSITHAFKTSAISASIVRATTSAYDALGSNSVAVRSSSCFEDRADASFAGQYQTVLDVSGIDPLLNSIIECWSSLWSARAIAYRAHHDFPSNGLRMAVVVQRFVIASVSGILFSRHPSALSPDGLYIEAAAGPGQPVVDGEVPTDTFRIDRPVGGRWRVQRLASPTISRSDLPIELADEHVVGLIGAADSMKARLGTPVDLEWGIVGNDLILLQARPITSGFPVRKTTNGLHGLQRMLHNMFLDYFPSPLYHFDRAALLSLIQHTLNELETTGLYLPPADILVSAGRDDVIRFDIRPPRIGVATPFRLLKFALKILGGLRYSPKAFAAEFLPRLKREVGALPQDLTKMTVDGLERVMMQCLSLRDEVFLVRRPYFLTGWMLTMLLQALLRVFYGREWRKQLDALMSDLSLYSTQVRRDLAGIQHYVACNPTIQDALRADNSEEVLLHGRGDAAIEQFRLLFGRFLDDHGSRTFDLIPLPSRPSWAASPNMLLRLLALNAATTGANIRSDAPLYRLDSAERSQYSGAWTNSLLARRFVNYVRDMMEERDQVIQAYELATVGIRGVMLEVARRLTRGGELRSEEDVVFLTIDEALHLLVSMEQGHSRDRISLQLVIESRKFARPQTIAGWKSIAPPPRRGRVKGAVIDGVAASPGVHVGRATLVRGEHEFDRLARGDILVCRASNPAWTVLFSVAGAVVADLGGPLSHAAIVAREFGIPAVLNTGDATQRLVDGRMYQVDGNRGTVSEYAEDSVV